MMYERVCCEIPNAITKTTTTAAATPTTTARRTKPNKNNEHKCKCQRNNSSKCNDVNSRETHHSCYSSASSKKFKTNDNMQPQHQQLQQQQQQANQLLHLQMPTESLPAFMESDQTTPSVTGCPILNQSPSPNNSHSPSSPLSTSSLSSESSSGATPSLGVNLRVTGQCSQGGRKYMEDYFSVAYQHSENAKDLEYAFFGIFDGHGGAEAATFAKEHLMMEIINQKLFWSDSDQDVLRAIREGYIATHFAMWRDQDKWPKTANGLPSTAGTTATVAFIRHEKIYIGHVGDSGIVLGYQNDGEKCWRAKQLTTDHKPESIVERTRIMRSGGKVVVKSGVPRVVWNRPRNAGHRGPIRHNTPIDEIPFLAVARSLGDLWSYNSLCNEFVVSPDPDVRVVKINPKTFRCLIFGTDGLWNVVTAQEAVNTVFQNEAINERLQQRGESLSNENGWMNPSKALVDRALGTWSARKMRADNTSVVTVILHPPNNSNGGHCNIIDNASAGAKLEGCLSDSFGFEYTQMSAAYVGNDETITYREMAEKYLPPEEYRNFNYYDDNVEFNVNNSNKSYYDERYTKISMTSTPRYPMSTTIESLEFMSESKDQHDADKDLDESTTNAEVELVEPDDNDDTDEEDCDDDEDGDMDELSTASNASDMISMNGYSSHFLRGDKDLVESPNTFEVNGGVDETTTSSYMTTFAESYNTLLGSDNGVGDAHLSGEVSTSNSSNSYKSHSATSMHELVQEQQRYQQQCMSEEEGYSLTKLETRREQQRCSAGVQTFRIFQQQQQQQQEQQQQQQQQNGEIQTAVSANLKSSTGTNTTLTCEQTYMWESRFANVFGSGNQRYQTYQQPHQQNLILEQQLKSLELNSLLQQEREEERQVELERQMEIERFQQQQRQQQQEQQQQHQQQEQQTQPIENTVQQCPHVFETSILTEDVPEENPDVNDSTSGKYTSLASSNSSSEGSEIDITIDEEYLLDEESEPDDSSVQINEISSSSCVEGDIHIATSSTTSSKSLKETSSTSTYVSSPTLLSPMPSSSTSRETFYDDALEPTSDSSLYPHLNKAKSVPQIIEKLEEIEILHEKPELVIESTPSTTMSTRSKLKTNLPAPAIAVKRRCKPNVSSRMHFPNIPNENQNQLRLDSKRNLKNGLQRHPTEAAVFRTKRQLRSASSSSSGSSSSTNSNICNISKTAPVCNIANATNKKACYHSNAVSGGNSIDYGKRTLRTRNSLTKDLKAKTALLATTIKRTAASVTTRFLRTQAVSLLSMHQNSQVLVTNSKKSIPTSTIRPPQQASQQRPFTTTAFNFINLRSRQIGGGNSNSNSNGSSNANGNGLISYSSAHAPEKQTQATTMTPPSTLPRQSTRSLQVRNISTNSGSSTPTSGSQTYARRNLRSLQLRPCIKTKISASTSTTGLTSYCKSMRSQSSTSMVTPMPPSPKNLNPTTANVTIAVTRGRNANLIMTSTPSSTSMFAATAPGLGGNRKRTNRVAGIDMHDSPPIMSAPRAPKRLKR